MDSLIEELVERIPHVRPLTFRYEMQTFKGDRSDLYAAVLDVMNVQTSSVARVHTGMALMCMGHPLGVDVLLAALSGTDERARKHALGELSSIWSFDVLASSREKEIHESQLRHDELFTQLVRIARPALQVESIAPTAHIVKTEREARSAGLSMWQDGEMKPVPEHLLGDVKLVSYEDTSYSVRFSYLGQEYVFSIHPAETRLDAAAVVQAFNAFMAQIGRAERAFRLNGPNGHDSWALFLCADEAMFREAARRLHIPLFQE